jgi:hypothetical protein
MHTIAFFKMGISFAGDRFNAFGFGCWNVQLGLWKLRAQLWHAINMVAVAMGDENIAQVPSALLEGCKIRPRIWHINRGRRATGGIMQEQAEIIAAAEELENICGHLKPS